ncbi:MAG: VUT family protein [Bacteroidota bacterium]|nr:VUT family protein [Bacteroidota bacterium]
MLFAFIYIAATLAANYTATWFIHFPVFGQVSIATFIFGITFTARDRVHSSLGRTNVYRMIALTALLNLIVTVMGGVEWRIVVASLIAIILAETADTEIYQHFINNTWGMRVFKSNSVSIPLDSLLFNLIAFAGVFTNLEVASIIFGEIIFKGLVSAVLAIRPLEYFRSRSTS